MNKKILISSLVVVLVFVVGLLLMFKPNEDGVSVASKQDTQPMTKNDVNETENYHIAIRRGKMNTMYQHIQRMKKQELDSEDYEHARKAILSISKDMLLDYSVQKGERKDSRANETVWSDTKGFASHRRKLVNTIVKQSADRQTGKKINKEKEIQEIIDTCQSCHSKYTIGYGESINLL